jgi:hypothetical protein
MQDAGDGLAKVGVAGSNPGVRSRWNGRPVGGRSFVEGRVDWFLARCGGSRPAGWPSG